MMAKAKRKKPRSPGFLVLPFTVVIDSREGHPYSFTGFRGDSKDRHADLVVPTKVAALKSGDYSIEGHEDRIAIERKSLDDAYNTFGSERDRFERELERLANMKFAAVVIEADWPAILGYERPLSHKGHRFTGKMFYRSVLAWEVKYGIPFKECPTRTFAERTTLRYLQRFWKDREQIRSPQQGELASLVRRMREAQRLYFKERDQRYLMLSKELERQVDALVKE